MAANENDEEPNELDPNNPDHPVVKKSEKKSTLSGYEGCFEETGCKPVGVVTGDSPRKKAPRPKGY